MPGKPIIIDLFAGAGGESSGIMQAFEEADMKVELYAVNHWELAIETHGLNHPQAFHYVEDVFTGTAKKHIRDRRVGLLWASPECIFHSRARGKAGPCNEQSRAGINVVLDWCQDLTVDRVIVENVKEFLEFGELDSNGRPIPERKGKLFEKWVRDMQRLGYVLDYRILCAADYGAPTSRERLFVQAVRKKSGKRIIWPQPSHSREQWIPTSAIIDWDDLGTLLQDRKKPLCENTLRRIESGIRKHWGEWAEPYIAILRGQSSTRSIHDPLPTLTTGQHMALVVPVDNGSNKGGARSVDAPLSTITTKQRHGILQSLVMGKHSNSKANPVGEYPLPTLATESGPQIIHPLIMGQHSGSQAKPSDKHPVPTITTIPRVQLIFPLIMGKHSDSPATPANANPLPTLSTKAGPQMINPLIVNYYGTGICHQVDEPLPTVTTKQRFGLLSPGQELALSYRMLNERELSRGTGFPEHYKFAGNKTQVVKQIGNAVPPPFAHAQVKPYVEEMLR